MEPSLANLIDLEHRVDRLADQTGISHSVWQKFRGYLAELKHHNHAMYAHSLRVGIYAYGLAAAEHQTDLKLPLYGGCGHDLGKCRVSNLLLNAKDLSPRGFERVKPHARLGFEKLKTDFLFTAFIAGLHHKTQHGGYGIDLETDSPLQLTDQQKFKIYQTAGLVTIADFFDALTTRADNKGLLTDPGDPDQVRQVLARTFPDQRNRVDWLLANSLAVSPK
jgi:response regulator RpfG family c-di-GMP phosphodiesterase